jgi:hypothetical protein
LEVGVDIFSPALNLFQLGGDGLDISRRWKNNSDIAGYESSLSRADFGECFWGSRYHRLTSACLAFTRILQQVRIPAISGEFMRTYLVIDVKVVVLKHYTPHISCLPVIRYPASLDSKTLPRFEINMIEGTEW